jgi:hypothetical protein
MTPGLLIASPLWYGVSKWVEENMEKKRSDKERALYGNGTPPVVTTYQPPGYVPPTWALVAAILIAVLMLGFLIIVPMAKAFNCGPRPTTVGLTGTTWGVILLLCLLFAQPIGIVLGVIFLIAGKCKGSLMIVPDGVVGGSPAFLPSFSGPSSISSSPGFAGLGGLPVV